MKMKPEHYAIILTKLKELQEKLQNAAQSYKDTKLSFTRFMWDAFNATRLRLTESHNVRGELDLPVYDYLNDTHITTALKSVMGELEISAW